MKIEENVFNELIDREIYLIQREKRGDATIDDHEELLHVQCILAKCVSKKN